LLVFAAFWATFAPAWAASPAFVDDAPRACARAENSHLGFFGDLAKTHRENSAQVAKPHQEAESAGWKTASAGIVGSNADPASLHKYLYAHANPVSFMDPTGHFSMAEIQMAMGSASILARMAIPTIARIGVSVAQRLLAAALRPIFVYVGGLGLGLSRGQPLTALDRFMRFFATATRSYPKVGEGWMGSLLQRIPGVQWNQHHVLIQQSWYRAGGPNQWYPGDEVANLGMQRLGNAGFNLLAIPGGLNRALGQTAAGTAAFATATYGSIAAAVMYIADMIEGAFDDEEPNPAP
jgi:hypothetical protein